MPERLAAGKIRSNERLPAACFCLRLADDMRNRNSKKKCIRTGCFPAPSPPGRLPLPALFHRRFQPAMASSPEIAIAGERFYRIFTGIGRQAFGLSENLKPDGVAVSFADALYRGKVSEAHCLLIRQPKRVPPISAFLAEMVGKQRRCLLDGSIGAFGSNGSLEKSGPILLALSLNRFARGGHRSIRQ